MYDKVHHHSSVSHSLLVLSHAVDNRVEPHILRVDLAPSVGSVSINQKLEDGAQQPPTGTEAGTQIGSAAVGLCAVLELRHHQSHPQVLLQNVSHTCHVLAAGLLVPIAGLHELVCLWPVNKGIAEVSSSTIAHEVPQGIHHLSRQQKTRASQRRG